MLTKTNEIRIETSTICNYNCVMCARSTFRRKRETMPDQLFDTIIKKTKDELSYIKSITISGFGEFSIDNEWRYKVNSASEQFDKVHIVTNLSLLTFNDLEFLFEKIADIRISLYGLDENTYKRVHRNPPDIHLGDIVKKIQFINKLKKNEQRIILNFIDTESNHHQTDAWIRYWKDKVDLVEVWKPHNWIDAHNYRMKTITRQKTCGRPFTGPIQVQVDGTVNVCCFDYNGETVIGDLKKQNYHEIFNGNKMNTFQKLHHDGYADTIRVCSKCDQRNELVSCKEQNIFNSVFPSNERVGKTSTEYAALL